MGIITRYLGLRLRIWTSELYKRKSHSTLSFEADRVNLLKAVHFHCDDINELARGRSMFTSRCYLQCLRVNICALRAKVTQ